VRYIIWLVAAVTVSLMTISAKAQQPVQLSPSQAALQVNSVINSMALALENEQKVISDLQRQIAELKAKYEPPPVAKK
jgi:hypothetical protein